jgi:hypothetical protein
LAVFGGFQSSQKQKVLLLTGFFNLTISVILFRGSAGYNPKKERR